MVEKMIKGPQIHPNKGHYMLNPMLLLLKLIYYGINIKIREKRRMEHSSIDQAPLY